MENKIILAGIDGCRNGWLVVKGTFCLDKKDFLSEEIFILATVKEIFDLSARIYAFDMPIGLSENYVSGGRTCDKIARKLLGSRRASIFSPPPRLAFKAKTYKELRKQGIKLSLQSFYLLPKVRELDEYLRIKKPKNIYETHPELVFKSLAKRPLPSKHTADGLAFRHNILQNSRLFKKLDQNLAKIKVLFRKDLLDAYACLLAAKKIYVGEAQAIPQKIEEDSFGLKMQIWF
ncbi:hypothetical protein Thein_1394 [Thermodesulfatator indicus DSM 15286]|uniref:NUDIX hydrolase n=1 Tax=Thermodesulfatator indicus (strain DSM 15286 / JCM 11887 / CIR29812) TaxID=667014 RepID=F8A9M9_THEID|nr:DUF429 domain-containing protein [Thermodesulfatator indicus]AEH45260.1 hypothetical protein Thein_1394 [Thermodesulfatator indicus DSM 15286]